MTKITENIWIGNSHDALHEKEVLKREGITAILNCAWDLKNEMLSHTDGFVMAQCGLSDDGLNSVYAAQSAILQLANLVEKEHKVLVHCHMGRSRSVLVVIYYLYLFENREKRSVKQIFDQVLELRPEVDNPYLKPLIGCFERAIKCWNTEKM